MTRKNSIIIIGSATLLEAMGKELTKMGYKQAGHPQGDKDGCIVTYVEGEWQFLNGSGEGCGSSDKTTVVTLNLPEDWNRVLQLASEEAVYAPKVGDWVVVLPEDEWYHNSDGKIASQVAELGSKHVWLNIMDGERRWYTKVRPATPTEIEIAKEEWKGIIVIDGYKPSYEQEGVVAFGCNEYTLDHINAYIRLITVSKAKIQIRGVDITLEMLNRIRTRLLSK